MVSNPTTRKFSSHKFSKGPHVRRYRSVPDPFP